ncbi:MAG: endonuclease/exonuclease/phosphatase family protein [Fervidobacterium sp.]|uniref:endonuclease/exonuclease/phosphatase family protein n=1 Tax=Fervidobacterium sp. TaxID=1871331 RepID=UPI00404B5AC5
MKVLTLNLHTYQEIAYSNGDTIEVFLEKYMAIQRRIVEMIANEDVDICFFQEAGQYMYEEPDSFVHGIGIKKSNYVRRLIEMLSEYGKNYHFVWDMAHYGFGIWEEGLGIVSKFPIVDFESRYVSKEEDPNTFYTRKIIRARIEDKGGPIDLYSVHFNWKEAGFEDEYENFVRWVEEIGNERFIIAGDFNVPYGSEEYKMVMKREILGSKVLDCWIVANPNEPDKPTFFGDKISEESARIDYVFVPERFSVKSARIVFENERVSDHKGVLVNVEISQE